jgi:hypothetical protein
MGIEVGGLLGLIILGLDIWAIITTFESGASSGTKVVWILIIIILPLVGLILWWFLGPK